MKSLLCVDGPLDRSITCLSIYDVVFIEHTKQTVYGKPGIVCVLCLSVFFFSSAKLFSEDWRDPARGKEKELKTKDNLLPLILLNDVKLSVNIVEKIIKENSLTWKLRTTLLDSNII